MPIPWHRPGRLRPPRSCGYGTTTAPDGIRRLATSTGRSVMRANGQADGFGGAGGRAADGFLTADRRCRPSGSGVLAAAPLIIHSPTGEARPGDGVIPRAPA